MTILTDSGILLRLHEPADPLHAAVRRKADELRSGGDRLVTATQNVAEFWNVCTRPKTARGGLGLTLAETDRRRALIDTSYSVLPEPPGAYAIWKQLILAHAVRGKQVHDARLVALMAAYGVTHVLTLNGPDFARYPGVTVIAPADAAAG